MNDYEVDYIDSNGRKDTIFYYRFVDKEHVRDTVVHGEGIDENRILRITLVKRG